MCQILNLISDGFPVCITKSRYPEYLLIPLSYRVHVFALPLRLLVAAALRDITYSRRSDLPKISVFCQ